MTDDLEVEEDLEETILTEVRGKCIKQFALIVNRIVRCHSNQQKESPFIVKNVILSTENSNLGK